MRENTENIDLKLSEEIAKAGGKKLSEIKSELERERATENAVMRELLQMNAEERREMRDDFAKDKKRLYFVIIVLLIINLLLGSMHFFSDNPTVTLEWEQIEQNDWEIKLN